MASRVTVVVLLAAWVTFVAEQELDALLPEEFRSSVRAYRADPERELRSRCARTDARCTAWELDPDGCYRDFFGEAADALPGDWIRLLEATYGGARPTPTDFVVEYEPWGFAAGDVPVPVRAWHGDLDELARLPLVEEVVRRLPDASLRVCPGEGHLLHPRYRAEYLPVLARDSLTDQAVRRSKEATGGRPDRRDHRRLPGIRCAAAGPSSALSDSMIQVPQSMQSDVENASMNSRDR